MEYLNKVKSEKLLAVLESGAFPMAEDRFAHEVHIIEPKTRAIIPLHPFHCPKRLAKIVRQNLFQIRIDYDFDKIIRRCANRQPTWINQQIIAAYSGLHRLGYAHSVECWQNEKLVGGLYGVATGGVFFGESMFSQIPNASKVALVHLATRLIAGGFTLLDVQFMTSHLRQFGAIEIPTSNFKIILERAKKIAADFFALPRNMPPHLSAILSAQEIGQIS